MGETNTNKAVKVYITACYFSDYAGHSAWIDLNRPEQEIIAEIMQDLQRCGCIKQEYHEQLACEAIAKARAQVQEVEQFKKLQEEFKIWKGNRIVVFYVQGEDGGARIIGGEAGRLSKETWLRARKFLNVQAVPQKFEKFATCYNDEFIYIRKS
jgi:hypothetical protein